MKIKQAFYIDVLSQELMSCLETEVILVYFEQYIIFCTLNMWRVLLSFVIGGV